MNCTASTFGIINDLLNWFQFPSLIYQNYQEMTPVWACRAFWCFQLPIYANSYLHVSLKLPSVTLFHITHYYILIHIKYPHKLSLIFHHLMFISVHTMLLYIVFLFALFTDNPVLSSYLESHDIF